MKPTSFKEIETYLYTSIVLPLKGLAVQELRYPSPLMGEDGNIWELKTSLIPLRLRYRRNYQRTQAERRRNYWIVLKMGQNRNLVLGDYNIKTHVVKLYKEAFEEIRAVPLMGKMMDVFQTNNPFTKVIVELGEYPEYQFGGGQPPRPGLRGYAIPEQATEGYDPYLDDVVDGETENEVPF